MAVNDEESQNKGDSIMATEKVVAQIVSSGGRRWPAVVAKTNRWNHQRRCHVR